MEIAFNNLESILNSSPFLNPLCLCVSSGRINTEDHYFPAKGHFDTLVMGSTFLLCLSASRLIVERGTCVAATDFRPVIQISLP